jgi:hypothetical protein
MSFLRGKKVKRDTFTKQTENEKAGLAILDKSKTRQDQLFDPLAEEYAATEAVERKGQTTGIANADAQQNVRSSIGTVLASDTAAANAIQAGSALVKGLQQGQAMETTKDLSMATNNENIRNMVQGNTVQGGTQAKGAETAYQSSEADRQLAKTNAMRSVVASAANQMSANMGDTGNAFKKSFAGFEEGTGLAGKGTVGPFGFGKTPVIAYKPGTNIPVTNQSAQTSGKRLQRPPM